MSEHGLEGQVRRETFSERVRSLVAGPEPYTADEIAAELSVARASVEDALTALEREGVVATKTVGDGLELWYRTDPSVDDRPEEEHDGTVSSDRIGDAVDALDVPGTSEMMRQWRRDAVRAVVERLHEAGPATGQRLRTAVYPAHAAGYDDADEWWTMVRTRLESLPIVERSPDEGWRVA